MNIAERLIDAARATLPSAYAPYSRFAVAAALIDERDRIFAGANVENASFSLTVCAERVAILNAVSAGARRIAALAVVGELQNPCVPCGACLQVISEFAVNAPVFLLGPDGTPITLDLSALLPRRFDGSCLKRRT